MAVPTTQSLRMRVIFMITRASIAVLISLLLSSCASTRDPSPVRLVQDKDNQMDCELILAEYRTNTLVAAAKIAKNNDDDVQDVVVGALIWPGLADFKNADGVEGNALLDRNIRLKEIAMMKECDCSDYPIQPTRYD